MCIMEFVIFIVSVKTKSGGGKLTVTPAHFSYELKALKTP